MSDQLKLRGGPTAQSQNFVGAEREITVDTGLKALRIHDGVTPGGHLVELATSAASSRSVVASDSSSQLEAVRVVLQQTIDDAILARDAAIAAGDTAVTTAYTAADTAVTAAYTAADTAITTAYAAADAAVTTAFTSADATTLASANSYTDTQIATVLDGSPDLLNTLNEIAAAIGDDADFITTLRCNHCSSKLMLMLMKQLQILLLLQFKLMLMLMKQQQILLLLQFKLM